MDFIYVGIGVLLYSILAFFGVIIGTSLILNIKKSMNKPDDKLLVLFSFIGGVLSVIIINLFSLEELSAILLTLIIGFILGILYAIPLKKD